MCGTRNDYTSKLAFKEVSSDGSGGIELSIAGNSGDRVALQAETATTKPRVVFVVANIRQVANDLRSRGLKAQKDHHASTQPAAIERRRMPSPCGYQPFDVLHSLDATTGAYSCAVQSRRCTGKVKLT
jgi:hypothetical protein